MILKTLKITNFRSHLNTETVLQPYTCVIGRNDSGKSSYLRAIRLLLDPQVNATEADISQLLSKELPGTATTDSEKTAVVEAEFEEVPDNWPIGIDTKLNIRRTFSGNGSVWEVKGLFPSHPLLRGMRVGKAGRGELMKDNTISADIKSILPTGVQSGQKWMDFYEMLCEKGLVEFELDWGAIDPQIVSNLFKVIFLAADTKAEEVVAGSKSPFDEIGGMLLREAAKADANLAEKTKQLEDAIALIVSKNDDGKWAYDPLNKMEIVLDEEIARFDKDVTVISNPQTPKLAALSFGLSLDVSDGCVDGLKNMGHGLRRSLVFALLRTFNRIGEIVAIDAASTQAEAFKLFLIEEPELYLHPQAELRRLLDLQELAKLDQTQVVLCTHSAFFTDIGEHRSIIRFSRTDRQETKAHGWIGLDLNPGDQAWLNTMRFLGGGATSMFFADAAILCEGDTEKLCLPALAQKLGVYNAGFEIVNCGSNTNLPIYQKVLEALRVPYVAWMDGDEDNPESIAVTAKRIKGVASNMSDIGRLVVNRHDWEDAAGVVVKKSDSKPLASWSKFVKNEETCPETLAKTIKSVYAFESLDLRTSP